MEKTFKVEKMSCTHCEAKIEKALSEAGVDNTIDLENKTFTVNTDLSADEVSKIVEDAGYPAVEL